MPRVNYSTAKGLFQDTGAGVKFTQEASSTNAFSNSGLLIGRDASNVNPYSESATQLFPLGTKLVYGDRTFRYIFTGAAIAPGLLIQSAAHIAHHTNNTITNIDAGSFTGKDGVSVDFSHAIGSRAISLEVNGDTDMVADQYAEGYLLFNDAQGEGQMLKIRTHQSLEQGAEATLIVETYDPLVVAIVKNASQCSLIPNPYKDVVTAPTAESGAIIGASVMNMADDRFGWALVSGPAALLVSEANLVIGHRVVRSDADAGGVMAANSDPLLIPVGQVMGSGVIDTEYAAIKLNIE